MGCMSRDQMLPSLQTNCDIRHYDEMRRTLDAAIDHRASEIAYDEVHELRQALYPVNWCVDNRGAAPKGLYDSMVDNLQSIKWLGIKNRHN